MIGYYCNICGHEVRSCHHQDELYFNSPPAKAPTVSVEIPDDIRLDEIVRVKVRGKWVALKRVE